MDHWTLIQIKRKFHRLNENFTRIRTGTIKVNADPKRKFFFETVINDSTDVRMLWCCTTPSRRLPSDESATFTMPGSLTWPGMFIPLRTCKWCNTTATVRIRTTFFLLLSSLYRYRLYNDISESKGSLAWPCQVFCLVFLANFIEIQGSRNATKCNIFFLRPPSMKGF